MIAEPSGMNPSMTVVTYTGMGSKVTLDSEAQTLTFEHSGMLNSKHRKKASPWVVPLGAIETIEWRETKIKAAEFRPLLHGRAGFDEKKDQDLSYVSGTEKIGEFVEAVEAARQDAAPVLDFAGGGIEPTVAVTAPKKSFLETLAEQAVRAEFEGLKLRGDSLHYKLSRYPVAGASAIVEVGGIQRRTTATRVVVGSAITFGIGTAIGAMAKKKTNNIYLSVELASGEVILIEGKAKQEGDARKFAAAVNQAAASIRPTGTSAPAAAPLLPPPPPNVPAGWYSDPSGQPIQRYWNGAAWTNDTAPLPPN